MDVTSSHYLQTLPPEEQTKIECKETIENSDPSVCNTTSQTLKRFKKNSMKRGLKDVSVASTSSSSSSRLSSKGMRLACKRRIPRVKFAGVKRSDGDVEAIALPLGMSFAAIVAQVMGKKYSVDERMSVDHLSRVCALAVRESLDNVFGDKFDCFVDNFEKSFGSTLRTLTLINKSSFDEGGCQLHHSDAEIATSVETHISGNNAIEEGVCTTPGANYCHSELASSDVADQDQLHLVKEEEEHILTSTSRQLSLRGQINQVALIAQRTSNLVPDQSMLHTFEKSIMEQARSNDLKAMEIGLTMRRLKLKETQLSLSSDSNYLERSKLAMGISKASFQAEKFKTQLEDMRHMELLRKCTDFLVAGLVIMSASLLYGAYVYSYKRITEATSSCLSSPMESKSWWMPNPMASFKSGMQIFLCQVQVVSRRVFALLMILSIGYLLVQRSATSKQTMPITFILLLLGVACGFAGKLCVDTLGGSGYHWLLFWETMCLLHFFSNICTSTLFLILHGPVTVTQGERNNTVIPYWFRRYLYYVILLILLPLLCGMMPFAGPGDWKNHFSVVITDYLSRDDH